MRETRKTRNVILYFYCQLMNQVLPWRCICSFAKSSILSSAVLESTIIGWKGGCMWPIIGMLFSLPSPLPITFSMIGRLSSMLLLSWRLPPSWASRLPWKSELIFTLHSGSYFSKINIGFGLMIISIFHESKKDPGI